MPGSLSPSPSHKAEQSLLTGRSPTEGLALPRRAWTSLLLQPQRCWEPHSPRERQRVPEASGDLSGFSLSPADPTLHCTNQPSSFLRCIPAILLLGNGLPGAALIPRAELTYLTLFLLLPLIILAYQLLIPDVNCKGSYPCTPVERLLFQFTLPGQAVFESELSIS